ncbi:DUF2092 domain-containing protein [Bradyrhizobium monzae]|uniref:DUF2092 domain-containing protein n=1 Tax=Bradyrhizobium sp. Oc8 TaxID=2876780 RepID=UPI001F255CBC|nr:DUF2092 domain-containing protein [Bradyrhizobium sp. Oc8]
MSSSFVLPARRLLAASVMAAAAACASPAGAQDAPAILKAMSSYVASQKNISLTYDTEIEVVTPQVQKIQFDSSGQLSLSRPDKIRATRTGGYADVELVSDGSAVSLLGKHANLYAQADLKGSIDEVVDQLRSRGADLPAADLLGADPFSALMDGVIEAAHIGRGVVDGVECEHLAFRNADVDWQLWVQAGDRPIPRKYVITSKAVGGSPQYTIRIKDWKTDVAFGPDAFAFKAPAGANKVDLAKLGDFDEVPAGALSAAKK